MKIEIPSDADLPAALAKLMGWKESSSATLWVDSQDVPIFSMACWSPLTDRNHSRLAVEECFRIGLGQLFTQLVVAEEDRTWDTDPLRFAQAVARSTPAQESRAAYITLAEYHQKKDKP